MERGTVLQMFRETGVLLQGLFLLTSGRHSREYLQCARLFQYPGCTEKIAKVLADYFNDDAVDLVIGPAIGGIILSYETARCLGVKAIFAEREIGRMTLRWGFEIREGSRVLGVEDVITTGGSVKEVIELVHSCGGQVVGVGAVVDRSGGKVDFGVKQHCVISMEVESYPPDQCPICNTGVPLTKPGSRNLHKS